MLRSLLAASVIVAASSAMGSVSVDVTTSTSGSSVANSLNVTTTDHGWTGAQIYVDLWEGSVVNLASGAGGVDTAPAQSVIDAFPPLLFDTYVGAVDQVNVLWGGAPELGGPSATELGPGALNATWSPSPGTKPANNDLSIGNFVFSDDARGTVYLQVAEPLVKPFGFVGRVDDGVLNFTGVTFWGDLDDDLFVGIGDLNIILGHWNQSPPDDPRADPSGDDFVGIDDLGIVLGNWNAGIALRPWPESPNADSNGDGFVGIGDLDLILSNWHLNVTPGNMLSGDFSGDGFVGFDDAVILNALWNSGTPPVAVPEPASAISLLAGGLCLLRTRRA